MTKQTVFYSETKASDDATRKLTARISTINKDRSRDVVYPRGAVIENYLKNPVVPFGHKYRELPVAKTLNLTISEAYIEAELEFPSKGTYPFADVVYDMYKDGFLNAWSIGFKPIKYAFNDDGGIDFEEWELLEFSAVVVPDNPEALTILRSKGVLNEELEKELHQLLPVKQKATSVRLDILTSKAFVTYESGEIQEVEMTEEGKGSVIEQVKAIETKDQEDQKLNFLKGVRESLCVQDKSIGLLLKSINEELKGLATK